MKALFLKQVMIGSALLLSTSAFAARSTRPARQTAFYPLVQLKLTGDALQGDDCVERIMPIRTNGYDFSWSNTQTATDQNLASYLGLFSGSYVYNVSTAVRTYTLPVYVKNQRGQARTVKMQVQAIVTPVAAPATPSLDLSSLIVPFLPQIDAMFLGVPNALLGGATDLLRQFHNRAVAIQRNRSYLAEVQAGRVTNGLVESALSAVTSANAILMTNYACPGSMAKQDSAALIGYLSSLEQALESLSQH